MLIVFFFLFLLPFKRIAHLLLIWHFGDSKMSKRAEGLSQWERTVSSRLETERSQKFTGVNRVPSNVWERRWVAFVCDGSNMTARESFYFSFSINDRIIIWVHQLQTMSELAENCLRSAAEGGLSLGYVKEWCIFIPDKEWTISYFIRKWHFIHFIMKRSRIYWTWPKYFGLKWCDLPI